MKSRVHIYSSHIIHILITLIFHLNYINNSLIFHINISPWKRVELQYTHKNILEILLNLTEFRFYLPFSDRFGTKRMSVWFQINRNMVNTIWFRFDFEKISLCVDSYLRYTDKNSPTLKRFIGILVNWRISTGTLTRITSPNTRV